jgi:hypothetical protein
MESPQNKLQELLDSILGGESTPEQNQELSQLLSEHPAMQAEVIEQLRVHSQLQWHCKDIKNEFLVSALAVERGKSVLPDSASVHARHRNLHWLAAMILLCGGMALWWSAVGGNRRNGVLAELVSQNDVTWVENSTALKDGKFVSNGSLQNIAGSYKLQFQDGPVVEVVGPSTLEIESGKLVRLSQGQASAVVPGTATGFRIVTPVVNVVDLGTSFGVSVDDKETTDVIVFDGKVDLEKMLGADTAPQRLVRGEGVEVDSDGNVARIMQVSRNADGQWRPNNHPDVSSGVIKRVRDNILVSLDGATLFSYHLIHGGLREDALAYGDNPHQWNGLSGKGLPKFLLGADYVMTFNDFRYEPEFEMTIELARPAMLYVFADDRIPAPEWLASNFEDTGVDIGLDEGLWNYVPPEYEKFNTNTTASGGGNSIDNVFSVWRRRCENTTPIVLGNAGEWATEGKRGRAMYGIAATPLEEDEDQAGIKNARQFAALENSVLFD